MPALYYLATLGCAKNVVDSADVRRALDAAGWSETGTAELADLLVVNSCGFITPAKQESIDTVLELATRKKAGARLVMAGCFVQRNAAELAAALPEVDAFFGISFADALAADPLASGPQNLPEPLAGTAYTPGRGYSRDAGPGSAWLKLADGCDNRCSYCAIPLIRGPFRARPAADILAEARLLAGQGVAELNLISQDTSRYADPAQAAHDLVWLLDELEKIDGPAWIRLLYLHPATTSDRLLERMTGGGKVLPYFDLPVQALVDETLARMRRRTTWDMLQRQIGRIRELSPVATIRTTLITGYPGESAADQTLTLERMRILAFDKLGCFTYSDEEGTPAAGEAPRIAKSIAARRLHEIMTLQQSISMARLSRHVGQTLPVLVGGPVDADGRISGRSPADAPDVDGLVKFTLPGGMTPPEPGTVVRVKITGSDAYDLAGVLA